MDASIKIALLGNTTTEYLGDALIDAGNAYGLKVQVYNSPYKQYSQEVFNPGSDLYGFCPDLSIILLEGFELYPEWGDFKTLQLDKDKKEALISSQKATVKNLVQTLLANSRGRVIINNFKIPYHSPLGILDEKYQPGLKHMIGSLNSSLYELSSMDERLQVFDYNGLLSYYGQARATDAKMYYIAKSAAAIPFYKHIASEYMRYILPLRSKNRKCLVLDLDNTLWGGVAAEDGVSGVKIDIAGTGRCYYDFQHEILNLYHRGILLAINSKNNPEDALDILESHPHMLLRMRHFSALRINWQNKAANLREIAEELNIGLDSLVFFDDSPVERELVKAALPEVKVVEVPADPSRYRETLVDLVEFESCKLTGEDIRRNEMYSAERERAKAQENFQTLDDYLKALDTRVSVGCLDEFSLPRMAQLTQKTNQFNMTTRRYREEQLKEMAQSGGYLALYCSVTDKFGDNGIVGVCLVRLEGHSAFIETFLVSCRVLGRNVEYGFLSAVVDILRKKRIEMIESEYIRSEKNRANEDFYLKAGFDKKISDGYSSLYSLEKDCIPKVAKYLDIVYEAGVMMEGG